MLGQLWEVMAILNTIELGVDDLGIHHHIHHFRLGVETVDLAQATVYKKINELLGLRVFQEKGFRAFRFTKGGCRRQTEAHAGALFQESSA